MTERPAVQRVDLTSCVASFRTSGDGYPIVIVPGLGLSSRFYEHSYATFERAGLRLIVPDLPGTGGTPGPRRGIDAAGVTSFMIEFVQALGVERAVFVGHSLGTQAVLLLAMHAPSLVDGIVLVGPTGGDGRGRLLRQLKGLMVESTRVRPGVIGAVAREYLRVSPFRYLGTWVKHRDSVAESRLNEIDCPAMLLLGGRDAVIDRAYVARLCEALAGLTIVEMDSASHALPRSQQAAFDAAVIAFALRVRG